MWFRASHCEPVERLQRAWVQLVRTSTRVVGESACAPRCGGAKCSVTGSSRADQALPMTRRVLKIPKAISGVVVGVVASAMLISPLSSSASAADTAAASSSVVQSTSQATAGVDEVCAILGIGSGAAGMSKALAKGGSWLGIGAAIACYTWVKASQVSPEEKRAYYKRAYEKWRAKGELGKLKDLGWDCHRYDPGGGGGTDSTSATHSTTAASLGYRILKMRGLTYRCTTRE